VNEKRIKIGTVALLMLVISGSVVSAWLWSSNDDKRDNNIKFDQSKFERLLQDGQFSVQAGDINSALKSYREAAKMKPTGQNFQRLMIHDGMLAEHAGDYNTSLKFYNISIIADPNSKTSNFLVQHRSELMRKSGQSD
jgi:outer membrane protein assembly factor BamD (BamD/ComL family)